MRGLLAQSRPTGLCRLGAFPLVLDLIDRDTRVCIRSGLGPDVLAAAEPNLVAMVPPIVIRGHWTTAVADGPPVSALEAALVFWSFERAALVDDPFVHIARHIEDTVVTHAALP